jgi:tight adherence protein B
MIHGALAPMAAGSFWSSGYAGVVVAAICALLLGMTVALVLSRRLGRGGARGRVAEFLSPEPGLSEAAPSAHPGHRGVLGRAARGLERERWWGEFAEKLELARFDRPAIQIVYLTVGCSIGGAALLVALLAQPIFALVPLVAGPLVTRTIVNHRFRRECHLFASQLAAHLQEMSAAIRAGHSLLSSIAVMVESASEPTAREFGRVVADEQLGVSLQDALRAVAQRMRAKDMEQVALVAELHQRTGGNMAEVLDRVAEGVRDRAELNGELRALTAQARISRTIVSALPVLLLGLIYVFNPSYLKPLTNTAFGGFLLVLGGSMIAAGSFVMTRIARIEV